MSQESPCSWCLGPHPSDDLEEEYHEAHSDRSQAAEMLMLDANGDPRPVACGLLVSGMVAVPVLVVVLFGF